MGCMDQYIHHVLRCSREPYRPYCCREVNRSRSRWSIPADACNKDSQTKASTYFNILGDAAAHGLKQARLPFVTCGLEYYTSLSRLLLGIGRTSLETLLSFIKASQTYVRSCTNLPVKTPQIKMMVKWSMALRLTMIHGTSHPIQHSNLPQRATQLKIVLVLVRAIAIGMSSSERKVPTPHLLSTLVAWTRSPVSTYLFGLIKDSTGTSEGSKLRCQWVLRVVEIGNEASDFLSPSLPALTQIEHTSGGTSRNSAA
jgi:hypothetical protein